jgi:hypothetical protein
LQSLTELLERFTQQAKFPGMGIGHCHQHLVVLMFIGVGLMAKVIGEELLRLYRLLSRLHPGLDRLLQWFVRLICGRLQQGLVHELKRPLSQRGPPQ